MQEFLPNTLSDRRRESLPCMPDRVCLSHVWRQLDAQCRTGSVAAQTAKRLDGEHSITRGRRRWITTRRWVRRDIRLRPALQPQLARAPRVPPSAGRRLRRTGAICCAERSLSNFDQRHVVNATVPVHDRDGPGPRTDEWMARQAAEGMDGGQPDYVRYGTAGDADLSGRCAGNGHHQHHPAERDGRTDLQRRRWHNT